MFSESTIVSEVPIIQRYLSLWLGSRENVFPSSPGGGKDGGRVICPLFPTGAGHMVQRAARFMVSRDLQQHWPASVAVQPLPGDVITTTAPVCLPPCPHQL